MPSHMTTLGFQMQTRQSFANLAMQAAQAGKMLEISGSGSYGVWSPGDGIELWVQIDLRGQIIGLTPHFSGAARMQVGLTERVKRSDDTPLDGAFYGWAGASEHDPEDGVYPFVFDAPDYSSYDALQLPVVVTVQLAAFAHSLRAFNDEEEFRASEGMMAAESCIPSGTFTVGSGGGLMNPPKSEVIFYGHVLETAKRTNPFTHLSFYWARVRSLGGEFDVVADPEVVEGTMVKNGIVGGEFWLSGRLKNVLSLSKE